MIWFYAIVGLAAVSLVYVLWSVKKRKKKLSSSKIKEFRKMIEDLEAEDDLFKKVIAADAILDKILSALGYEGTFKDKFEIAQSRFKNSEAIWQAHKLRNKMTHEPEVMISEKTQILALRAYLKAFRQILK